MADYIGFPPDYLRFKRLKRNTARIELARDLNRFCYRYRLAKCFEGIFAPGVGPTLHLYSIMNKVFLCVTAYEALVKAGFKWQGFDSPFKNEFYEPILADNLRDNKKLKTLLTTYLDKEKDLINKVDDFFSSYSADVHPIAFGLRHVYAHGDFTASAAGMRSVSYRNDINQLGHVTLKNAEIIFSTLIQKL